jgi:diguanylate cyclase (GGDEF)-like protein/PAS domain S-box-containing protein
MNSVADNFISNTISLCKRSLSDGAVFINSQWAQMLGYSLLELEPFTSNALDQLIHPEDIEISKKAIQAYLDGKTSAYSCEIRLKHKNGTWIWIHDYGQMHPTNAESSSLWLNGYSQDITKWKNAEAAFDSNQTLLHNIINEMPDVFVLKDEKGDFLLCNQTVAKLYQTTPEQMVGKSDEDFGVPKELSDFFRQNVLAIMQKGETELVYEDSADAQTGEIHHFRSIKKPLKDHAGKNQILVIAQDITEIVQANEKIAKNEKRLREVFEVTQEGIWEWHVPSGVVEHNSQWYKILGFEEYELSDTVEAFSAQVHPDDKALVWEKIQTLFAPDTQSYYSEHRMICKNSETIWVQDRGKVAERDQFGQPLRVLGSFSDITRRKEYEQSLLLSANVFTYAREGIIITDGNGKIVEVNQAFVDITGYTNDEAVGKFPNISKSDRHPKVFYKRMWNDLLKFGYWSGEIWNRRKNGEIYPETLTISSVKDKKSKTLYYVGIFSDITAQKKHEEELLYIANYDHLTGLPNRLLLADRLNQAMLRAKRNHTNIAIAYIDLDAFKEVNDTYGHAVGDELLKTISSRMQKSLREEDTFARIGGDEFVAVLSCENLPQDKQNIFNPLLSVASEVISIDNLTFKLSASIGISFFPQETEIDADQLLRQADQAMYQAKLSGKNCFHIFDTQNDQIIRKHHQSLHEIETGLRDEEFVLYYQPKINLLSKEPIGLEALIRWQHPSKGLLSPAFFLPEIEFHSLGILVGEWVIDAALKELERLQELEIFIPISVNITANHFQQSNFVSRLETLLHKHSGVHPKYLEIEILETSIIKDITYIISVMEQCTKLGIRFSLDDFGTGFSSLSYLKRLPVHTIKIDQSFVRDMLSDPEDAKIIAGIMGLAQAFDREVIAEGVEDEQHVDALLKLGCTYGQGYVIARPMPSHQMHTWIKQRI